MAKKKAAKQQEQATESFEESLGVLEQVVADLESGELGLAESLKRYEEGIGKLKWLHAQLEQAERRVELLSGVDAEGAPITTHFEEPSEEDLPEKQAARSAKRTAAKKPTKPVPPDNVDDRPRLF